MQSMTQPTPRPLPRKDSRLTVRLCAITGTQIQSLAISVGARSTVPSTHLKPRQEAGSFFIYFARTSRAHVALCGCVRRWTVFGCLDPDKGCFCMTGQLQNGKQCLMQSGRQPTTCSQPRKAAGLTVRLRTITGMRIRSLAAAVGTRPKSPRMPSKAKQGAGAPIYFGRVSRTRALPCTECTDPCERARILQGFRAAVARAVYGEPGESAAPRMPKQGAPPLIFTSGAFRARARCRVRIVRILHDLRAVAARAVHENRGASAALRGRGGLPGSG